MSVVAAFISVLAIHDACNGGRGQRCSEAVLSPRSSALIATRLDGMMSPRTPSCDLHIRYPIEMLVDAKVSATMRCRCSSCPTRTCTRCCPTLTALRQLSLATQNRRILLRLLQLAAAQPATLQERPRRNRR